MNRSDVESFGEQFLTAGHGYGTTLQSARATLKRWYAEAAELVKHYGREAKQTEGYQRYARNIAFYEGALKHYARLRREGRGRVVRFERLPVGSFFKLHRGRTESEALRDGGIAQKTGRREFEIDDERYGANGYGMDVIRVRRPR